MFLTFLRSMLHLPMEDIFAPLNQQRLITIQNSLTKKIVFKLNANFFIFLFAINPNLIQMCIEKKVVKTNHKADFKGSRTVRQLALIQR